MSVLGVLPYWQLGPWELGPLTLHSFGLSVVTGIILALWLVGRFGNRVLGVPPEKVHNLAIYLVICGWIFSHIFEVLTYQPHVLRENPFILFQVWGSISSVGGVLGGGLAYIVWCYRNPDEDHLAWASLAAWTLPFAFLFGRIGCALVHDHPGQAAADFGLWNWIYDVTGGAVPEIFPLAMEFPDGVIRHDLGFYEAIWWAGISALFLYLSLKPRRRGLYLWLLPLLYAPYRFMLDFLRAQPGDLAFGGDVRYLGLTPAQYTVALFFILGIYGWTRWRNNDVMEWAAHKEGDGKKDKKKQEVKGVVNVDDEGNVKKGKKKKRRKGK